MWRWLLIPFWSLRWGRGRLSDFLKVTQRLKCISPTSKPLLSSGSLLPPEILQEGRKGGRNCKYEGTFQRGSTVQQRGSNQSTSAGLSVAFQLRPQIDQVAGGGRKWQSVKVRKSVAILSWKKLWRSSGSVPWSCRWEYGGTDGPVELWDDESDCLASGNICKWFTLVKAEVFQKTPCSVKPLSWAS